MQVGWTFIPGAYRRGDSPFKLIEMSMILNGGDYDYAKLLRMRSIRSQLAKE